jgi:hypothetical protein
MTTPTISSTWHYEIAEAAAIRLQGFEARIIPQKLESMMFRQGDVLTVPVSTIPEQLDPVEREGGRVILARGERTGHAHAIKAEGAALFRDPKLMAVFLTVSADGPVALNHDEHDTITLPPGRYQIVRQREYTPEAIVNVAD